MAASLSSLVRRVSGSSLRSLKAFTKPISGVVNVQSHNFVGTYLRLSTSIHSQILSILDSDISSNSTEEVEDGVDYTIVVESKDNVAICGVHKDEKILLETGCDDITNPTETTMSGYIFKGKLQFMSSIEFKPDTVAIQGLTVRDYQDGHLKDFEKFLDDRGINIDLNKFLSEKFEDKHRYLDYTKIASRQYSASYSS